MLTGSTSQSTAASLAVWAHDPADGRRRDRADRLPACGPARLVRSGWGRLDLLRGRVEVAQSLADLGGHLEFGGTKNTHGGTCRSRRS